jgi:hypothetical protein
MVSGIDDVLGLERSLTWGVLWRVAMAMRTEKEGAVSVVWGQGIHREVKRAVREGRLLVRLQNEGPDEFMVVDISHLLEFSKDLPPAWEWCRQLCQRWSDCLGKSVGELESDKPRLRVRPRSHRDRVTVGPNKREIGVARTQEKRAKWRARAVELLQQEGWSKKTGQDLAEFIAKEQRTFPSGIHAIRKELRPIRALQLEAANAKAKPKAARSVAI